MLRLGLIAMLALPVPAAAEMVVPTRTIRSQAIIGPADVQISVGDMPGAAAFLDEVIGLEARVVLYAGRPIRLEDIGAAAIVERNQIVELIYVKSGLRLTTEARALARGGVGDSLRVMNLSSRATVTGVVAPDGSVHVGSLRDAFN